MHARARVIGKLEIVKRLPSSRNGNPRWEVLILDSNGKTGTVCRTAPDSGLGYRIGNYDGEIVSAIVGTHHGVATIDTCEKHSS